MPYWLYKTEPSTWSWDDQVKAGANGHAMDRRAQLHQAKANLKAMKKGDRGFFYHTGDEKAVVGIVEVTKEYYPRPDRQETGIVRHGRSEGPVKALKQPVTLAEIKAEPETQGHGPGAARRPPVGAAGQRRGMDAGQQARRHLSGMRSQSHRGREGGNHDVRGHQLSRGPSWLGVVGWMLASFYYMALGKQWMTAARVASREDRPRHQTQGPDSKAALRHRFRGTSRHGLGAGRLDGPFRSRPPATSGAASSRAPSRGSASCSPRSLVNNSFAMRSRMLLLIDGGYWLRRAGADGRDHRRDGRVTTSGVRGSLARSDGRNRAMTLHGMMLRCTVTADWRRDHGRPRRRRVAEPSR